MNDKEEYLNYLRQRKSSEKTNYYLAGEKELQKIRSEYTDRRPRLLLHACCAVCAGWPLEYLSETFDITIYYGNSNIWPAEEYEHRLSELKRLVHEAWNDRIDIVVPAYDNEAFNRILEPRRDDPEGWKRCFLCYEARLDEACAYADEHDYDYFTTVMTVSRQKNSQKINEIGKALDNKYSHVHYFVSDFKKKNGHIRRNEIIAEYSLYNQQYCGCMYSYRPDQD